MRGGESMARLPALITDELAASYDEDYQTLEKNLYKVLGGIIRKEEAKERIKEIEKNEN